MSICIWSHFATTESSIGTYSYRESFQRRSFRQQGKYKQIPLQLATESCVRKYRFHRSVLGFFFVARCLAVSSRIGNVEQKKAAEARLAAQESGIELDDTYREEDIFELQHHHLLRCLEKTTVNSAISLEPTAPVAILMFDFHRFCLQRLAPAIGQDREFVELEIPYNGQPKRPGSPSPLASPTHSTNSTIGLLQSCCGRCCSQRYQVWWNKPSHTHLQLQKQNKQKIKWKPKRNCYPKWCMPFISYELYFILFHVIYYYAIIHYYQIDKLQWFGKQFSKTNKSKSLVYRKTNKMNSI